MTLAAPIWLLALIPWAALSLWLMLGRRPRVDVPFIELWHAEQMPARTPIASLRPPPLALACLLLAMLLSLIAAARPGLRTIGNDPITLILDRGVAMSGRTTEAAVAQVYQEFKDYAGMRSVEFRQVPGERVRTDPFDWFGRISPAVGLDTHEMLAEAIRSELERTSSPIVVVTTQRISSSSPRVGILRLPAPENVGIVLVAARQSPRGALMVRVRNDSGQTQAAIELSGQIPRQVELPPQHDTRDYIFDLDQPGEIVSIHLQVDDELAVDNRAWLVRSQAWPRIEVRAAMSAELTRMIDVYARHRPASERSLPVVVTDSALRSLRNQLAVIVPSESVSAPGSVPAVPRVLDHPITSEVKDWSGILADAAIARPPGEGWTPLATAGNEVFLAVREQPARQVWVGFASRRFARSADFVVFWTNVFDWVSQLPRDTADAGDEYRCEPVTTELGGWKRLGDISGAPLTAEPSPGVYRGPDGQLRAMCALDVSFPPATQLSELREVLKSIRRAPTNGTGVTDFSSYLILAALGLIVLASVWWRRRGVVTVSASTVA